jgi:RHS repeat-associated protein
MREVTRTPKGAGPAQKLESAYDGVLLSSLTASGAANGTFTYQWTDDHLLDGLTVEGEAIDIDRDDDGLMTKYGPFAFTRGGPNGEETAIAGGPGSLRVDVELDDHGRIESRTHKLGATQLYRLDLTYDDRGRIETRTEAVGAAAPDTLTYEYDDDGRLLGARRGAQALEAYEYDGRGNRRTANGEAATFTADDRVIERGGVAYQYDAAGFLRSRGSHAFTYSSRGELLEATVGGETVTYAYDAMGRRTARIAGGKTTEYLYGSPDDPFQLTASRHDGVLTTYFYSEKGHLFAYKRGGATFYVMTDQAGSPRRVVNQAGTVVKTVEYDAFGRVLSETGTETLVHGFAGGLADPVTGLVRMGMRDYDPAAGRWTAKNPLLFGGGASNLYSYAGNNPVNISDPSGLPSLSVSAGAGGMLGVKGAWNDKGFSFCWEFGVGIGASTELDLDTETIDPSQSRLFASGEVGAGPLKGSLEYEYDTLGGPCMEGEGQWKPKACFFVCYGDSDGVTVENPYMPDADLGKLGQKMKGMFKGKGASAQIKAGVRVCKNASW